MKKNSIVIIPIFIATILIGFSILNSNPAEVEMFNQKINLGGPEIEPHPLSIEALKQGEYPGSEITIEQTLDPRSNYDRYIASYRSEGLKIYGLLTIPNAEPESSGHPAIIFNHGYINPNVYKTTEKYVAYQDAFARDGYVTFKPDYRGHGNSEGVARGGYGVNDYTIDVLNATSSIQKLENVDQEKIGMWGHSMGGHITLESMVVSDDIKAGVIWAGVVVSYQDLLTRWRRNRPSPSPGGRRGRWRNTLADQFGSPQDNPSFWDSLSANSFLEDVSGPIQLHHGSADSSVPVEFSQILKEELLNAEKEVELYEYPGDDHNISSNLRTALNRSVEFFNTHLK